MTYLALLVSVGLGATCWSRSPAPGQEPLMQQSQQPVHQLLSAPYSGITEPRRAVIRQLSEWATFWQLATRGQSPAPALPAVNFEEEMVIAAALGARGSGGYSIAIERVMRDRGKIVVSVRQVSPGRNCMTTQALTAPVVVVRVPRTDDSVVFVETEKVRDCP